MILNCKNDGLFVFWDLDDVLVTSSPFLQTQVDNKTCFKTRTLKMLEQLKRNCEFFRDQVKDECNTSFAKRRLPHLKRFPLFSEDNYSEKYPHFSFGRMTKEQYEDIYVNPVKACEYYVKIVDELLNQFLEERDSFLEKDNLPRTKTKKYDFRKERENLEYFKEIINNNKSSLLDISIYCLMEIKKLSCKAKKMKDVNPSYGALVKMDSNDIIRENSDNSNKDYFLYDKPVHDVTKVLTTINYLQDIIDNIWEYLSESKELINYNAIYVKKNVNLNAINVIKLLDNCPYVAGQAIISHHNGIRESYAKDSIVFKVLPEMPFIGMRFHDGEHIGERRGRSSKFMEAIKYLDIDPSKMVLIDDSTANNKDWENGGAKSILYRKITNAELMNNKLENTGFRRITDFDANEIIGILKEYYELSKEKIKIKK